MSAQTWATVRFDLQDVDGTVVGTITPADPGALTCKGGVRTIRGLSLFPEDTEAFDPYQNRLAPMWVETTVNGSTETPLGVFVAVSGTNPWVQYQNPRTGQADVGYFADWDLQDLTAVLDVPLVSSYGLAQGAPVTPLMQMMLEDLGFTTYDLAWFPVGVQEPVVYEQGRDTTFGAFEDMMQSVGGRFFFDRDGIPTSTYVPAPQDLTPTETYATGDNILDRPVYANEPFAPNRWEAVAGTDTAPIIGTYDLPSDAVNSYANRGFLIVERFDVAALDQTTANTAAQAKAVDDILSSQTVTFTVQVDPTLDPYECVTVDGTVHIVDQFSFGLSGDTVCEITAGRVWT